MKTQLRRNQQVKLDRATLYQGNSLEILPLLEAGQFTACVCDPPYHLTQTNRKGSPRNNDPKNPRSRTRPVPKGFMGKAWDGGDIAFRVEFWREVLRVLKPGAMLLAFGGTRTFHRLTCAIEDAGFEIRDCLMWLYGSGFPKSLDISKAIDKAAGARREIVGRRSQPDIRGGNYNNRRCRGKVEILDSLPATKLAKRWNGWGTALKPAWEPVVLAMKPLGGTFAENARRHGVAGLNIGASRVSVGKGGRCRGEKTARKRYAESGSTNFATTLGPRGGDANGRWPANLLLDETSRTMLDKQSGVLTSGKMPAGTIRRNRSGFTGKMPTRTARATPADSGGASRFFYCAKASRRDQTCDGRVENNHPTVKPQPLMEYLCRLVTPPDGGIILDPFMGSGSTGIAALVTGNRFVGIELEPASFRTARQRINTISCDSRRKPVESSIGR